MRTSKLVPLLHEIVRVQLRMAQMMAETEALLNDIMSGKEPLAEKEQEQ